jgi:DNA-binding GntR family transcriptional regulator
MAHQADVARSRPPVPDEPQVTAAAYARLRDMLLSGALPGGTVIQERRLAEEFGLSRTPIREALRRLEGESLLRRDGRHLIVASVTVGEVMEVLVVRRSLESDAVRAACGRMPKAQIAAIRSAIVGMTDAEMVDNDQHWNNDDLLHLSIAEASGNSLLLRFIRDLRQRTRMFGLRRIPSRFDVGKQEHVAILDALESEDGEAAAQHMRCHIDHARDAILATLSGAAGMTGTRL